MEVECEPECGVSGLDATRDAEVQSRQSVREAIGLLKRISCSNLESIHPRM